MMDPVPLNYQINQYVLDVKNYQLTLQGEVVPLEPQVFDLLLLLVENRDRVVSRDEMLAHVWKGRLVSDNSINNNIKSARKALGDDGHRQQVIKTIHSRGYQFIAPVQLIEGQGQPNSTTMKMVVMLTGLLLVLMVVFHHEISGWLTTEQHQTVGSDIDQPIKKLVILPFINNKPDSVHDYLGIALASQVISDLSYQSDLLIQPAAVSRTYADSSKDPLSIGRELNADFLVSGDYLVENHRIRLNVELLKLPQNQPIWQETLEGDLDSTFQLQDRLTTIIGQGLSANELTLTSNQRKKDTPQSALAYEYFLRGIAYPYSNEGHQLSIAMLQKSIELDPGFAPAYAHIGSHRRLLEQHGRILPQGLKKAEWYYQKALELNPDQLVALSNLATLYAETNRTEEAVIVIQKMLSINPNDASSHFALGYVFRYAGLLELSIAHMEKALRISPGNPRFRSIIATYISAGQYSNALNHIHLDNGEYGIGYKGIIAYEQMDYPTARKQFNQLIEMNPNDIWGLIAQTYLAIMDGDKDTGLKALRVMMNTDIQDAENTYYFADFFALLGEKEDALNQLKLAVETGYFNYPYMSRNKAFQAFQGDPRYKDIMSTAQTRHVEFKNKFKNFLPSQDES